MDLIFIDEKRALKPPDPEFAASMALVQPVRDSSLLISTSSSAAAAVFSDSCKRSTRVRLASALKSLGRSDDALSKGSAREADYWLLAASYDFAHALLYSREVIPSRSHIIGQLKGLPRGTARSFEAYSLGAGLEKSSRASCASRLEGVAVLQDVLRGNQEAGRAGSGTWSEARLQIVQAKAQELSTRMEHAESYSFLGQEVVQGILEAAKSPSMPEPKRPGKTVDVGHVFAGGRQLLGDRLLKELGLNRGASIVSGSIAVLRDQVSALAKKG
jgi:hypothetical protein